MDGQNFQKAELWLFRIFRGGHQKVETNMEKIKNLVKIFLYVSVLLSFFIICEDRLRLAMHILTGYYFPPLIIGLKGIFHILDFQNVPIHSEYHC